MSPSRSIYTIIREFYELAEEGESSCKAALNSPIIDEILLSHENNPFELVVTEIFDTDCMLGVIYKMNLSYVGLTSCGLFPYHFDRVALPDTPSVSILLICLDLFISILILITCTLHMFLVYNFHIRWIIRRNEF